MEFLRTNDNGADIYTDYGHHPTEINAVYHAMRKKYHDKKIIAIVQPHQLRRVLEFRHERVRVLKQFDTLYLYPIFAAREDVTVLLKEYNHSWISAAVTAEDVGRELALQVQGKYITEVAHVQEIMENAEGNEVVVLFTAGSLDYQIRKL